MPSKKDFADELHARFRRAVERHASSLEINSGELHRSLGGYPGPNHQMPSCCMAMHDEFGAGDRIVSAPPSGHGASLTIWYRLPRTSR